MDLGAHSMTHPDLRTLGERELAAELADSKAAVEDITGRRCRAFAYPFGLHDARVRRATARSGFAVAFAYSSGPWHRLAAPRHPAT
jgi:peptidoglycan/xylan/chitin deacetylase (PgdA/CDA1 family)